MHVGGHLAFRSQRSPTTARARIFLLEDCAHAHGASWEGRRPGSTAMPAVYSMYATKTISTGEGGMLVPGVTTARLRAGFRNYGKPSYEVHGLNFRMNEFTAALGLCRSSGYRRSWRGRTRSRARVSTRTTRRAWSSDGNDLRALQVRRVRLARALHWARLRRAVPPDHGPPCRSAQFRLGRSHHSCVPLYYRPERGA